MDLNGDGPHDPLDVLEVCVLAGEAPVARSGVEGKEECNERA